MSAASSPPPPLRTELAAGVLTLTLDRPDKRNALDTSLIDALATALERADLDAEVRVVALRGAGKDFCAGADLQELLDSADRSPEENDASALRLGQVFLAIRRLPKPVVAVVQGRALAGGAGLATACDLVLAGAGVQRGAVIGKTNGNGTAVVDRQVDHANLFHTYLRAVGLDPTDSFDVGGRLMPMADPASKAIAELLA